jgi:predicted DNA-binding transcriptional regulator AlpA
MSQLSRKLRTKDITDLERISARGLFKRIERGAFPAPDGNDGRLFWLESAVERWRKESAANPRQMPGRRPRNEPVEAA